MKELLQLFLTFFKMGAFTIGGGLAMIPLIQHTIVDKKGWLDEAEMADCITISQALPGVIAINAATYVGKRKKGIPGALAASLGVIMPSFIIIIIAVSILVSIGSNERIEGAFTGVKAAACGLIAYAGYRMSKQVIKNIMGGALAIATFISVVFFEVSAIWTIIVAAIIGILFWRSK